MKKCPFCAEEIQDAAIVCRHCGRELTGAVARPVPVMQAVPASTLPAYGAVGPVKKSRPLLTVAMVFGGAALLGCFGLCAIILLAPPSQSTQATRTARVVAQATADILALTPSRTPVPTKTETPKPIPPTNTRGPSPTPTKSPTPEPTEDRALGMSLSEFVNHYEDLTELQRDPFIESIPGKTIDWTGKVYDVDERGVMIDMPGSIWNGFALLRDLPPEVAITIAKDSRIHFTGTIEETVEFLFFYVYIVDVEIVD